jgi:hypothetical protein
MIHARRLFRGTLIVAISLFSALPALHAQEKTDLDAPRWQPSNPGYGIDSATRAESNPGIPLLLRSQTVDNSSEPPVLPGSETAIRTDSSAGSATETILESPNADSQGGPPTNTKSDWDKDPNAWKFIVYPVYAWVPFFSTRVDLPEIPSPPGGGGPVVPTSTTSGSLNGAAFAGAEIFKGKWSGTFTFLYAGLSSTRTTPRTTVTADFIYGQAMVERDVYKGLYFGVGFRRMALDLTATIDTYPSVSRTPGFWDPLLSATYRKQLSKKWRVTGHMDGGGFGVGSEFDIGAAASADWRFAKHFGMTMGGAYLHFEDANTVLRKTLTIEPTMYGPTFGFGIYF